MLNWLSIFSKKKKDDTSLLSDIKMTRGEYSEAGVFSPTLPTQTNHPINFGLEQEEATESSTTNHQDTPVETAPWTMSSQPTVPEDTTNNPDEPLTFDEPHTDTSEWYTSQPFNDDDVPSPEISSLNGQEIPAADTTDESFQAFGLPSDLVSEEETVDNLAAQDILKTDEQSQYSFHDFENSFFEEKGQSNWEPSHLLNAPETKNDTGSDEVFSVDLPALNTVEYEATITKDESSPLPENDRLEQVFYDDIPVSQHVDLDALIEIDTLEENLYPGQAFTIDPEDMSLEQEMIAGERAFAEASQLIFPETVQMSDEWNRLQSDASDLKEPSAQGDSKNEDLLDLWQIDNADSTDDAFDIPSNMLHQLDLTLEEKTTLSQNDLPSSAENTITDSVFWAESKQSTSTEKATQQLVEEEKQASTSTDVPTIPESKLKPLTKHSSENDGDDIVSDSSLQAPVVRKSLDLSEGLMQETQNNLLQKESKTPSQDTSKANTLRQKATAIPKAILEKLTPKTHTLTLGDLEVISVCSLNAEQRFLLVKSDDIFALMGQTDINASNKIFVIKIFNSNPILYQKTFTAVADNRPNQKGLYIIQLGNWRGIVSLYQVNMTLYTDLG